MSESPKTEKSIKPTTPKPQAKTEPEAALPKAETFGAPGGPFEDLEGVKRLEHIAGLWMGTPFLTNNQIVKKGVDCVRLPVCIYQSCGAFPADFEWPQYGSTAEPKTNWTMIKAGIDTYEFERVKNPDNVKPGDLLVFKVGRNQTVHLGVKLSSGFFHVMPSHTARRDGLTQRWKGRLTSIWRPVKKF